MFSSLHAPVSCSAATPNDDTLAVGQALAVGGKLISRNGKFALGFFQPGSAITCKYTTTASPGWYLGVWYNMIPVFTTVWVANRDTPIGDPVVNLTELKISADGNLVISTHNATEPIIWATHIVNRTQTRIANTTAVLLNSGNLALMETSSSAVPLWQSFDYPTDVLLPGAKFGWNKVTGLNRQFTSNKSLIDPGLGSYTIELDTNGGMLLSSRSPYLVYWSWSGSSLASQLVPLLTMILDMNPQTKGLISAAYVDNNEEEYYTYTLLNESSLVYALLDISGQLKLIVWSQATQSWQTPYAQPAVPCTAYAACGPFTVCNSKADPFCNCMDSFSLKSPRDWEVDDRTGGCIRNTHLDCNRNGNTTVSTDMFLPITRVTLPYNSQRVEDATTGAECAEACLNDCSCTAYSHNSSRCLICHGELLNVKENDDIDNSSEDVLFLHLSAQDFHGVRKSKRKSIIGAVSAAIVISFGLLMLMLLSVIWRNKFKCFGGQLYNSQDIGGGIVAFRYADLGHATKNFSEMLGGGGFGSVFKGVLGDSTPIAVKRLDGARQGEKQFRAETLGWQQL
ncbi:G-type lectin S-receptor-like serine/threonine-protein kinase At2g19130 [Miscanthus floridulus]|uniref:G-type lectin S-receptor-like serine/threonine-protein kinase At2g19130 n=1 Tax=Miscanthus floridulus TaxID=154761 RepID=UPI0034592BF0